MLLDIDEIAEKECDRVLIRLVDNVGVETFDIDLTYTDGDFIQQEAVGNVLDFNIKNVPIEDASILFHGSSSVDVAIVEVSYFKNNKVVGSSLLQDGNCELNLLKYKVELPRGAKVTLFDDESIEAQFLSWNIPCPTSFPNMTFLQVKAANGFEQQITPSAGSYMVELWTELGRRYAVFGEIWTYSFAQVLWFADLKVELSNYESQDVVPIAGEGGTIVTTLPQ